MTKPPTYSSDRRAYRAYRKAQLIAYKGGVCERCRRHYHPSVFEFHHRDPSIKESQLTATVIADRRWSWVLAEADKCHLLCSNCHKEVHAFLDMRFLTVSEEK